MSFNYLSVLLLCSATILAFPAAASTLIEGDSHFSGSWTAPTVVTSGTTLISGTGAPEWMGGDRLDIFKFSGLNPSAASMVFDFSLTDLVPSDGYRNGGGSIYYSFVPFSGAYYVDQGGGEVLGSDDLLASHFDVIFNPWEEANSSNRGASSFTLNLGEAFKGDLFLALDFTYGRVSYNINSPSWAAPSDGAPLSPVPLPAAGLLMLAGLSSLGLAAAWRRRR